MKKLHLYLLALMTLTICFSHIAHAAEKPAHIATKTTKIPVMPPIVATYDVYVGGLHLVQASILFKQDRQNYLTRVRAGTVGFWKSMAPWNTVLEASGRMGKDKFIPAEFYTRDEWKKKPKITKLHFKKNGDVVPEFDPPNRDVGREEVTAEQKRGSLDPVTALLQILAHVAVHKECDITVPVFDGKRRFDVTGIDQGRDNVDEGDYNFYKGDARLCTAEFNMIAGEWKDRAPSKFWQKSETEAGRDPFQVWLASAGPYGAELPVKLESTSVFGRIVVHLSNWHYAGPHEMER